MLQCVDNGSHMDVDLSLFQKERRRKLILDILSLH